MHTLVCRRVPSAEGVSLATDVYLPDGPGPFPTVVVRTPYHRVNTQGSAPEFVRRGYALVAQDVRGKYDSDGVFEPLVYEAVDGQATLDWVAEQRWCNGRIGLWGRSYPSIVQVPAAAGGHEALKCILPSVSPSRFFQDWIRYDGCFGWGNALRWVLTHTPFRTQPPQQHFTWQDIFQLRTLDAVTERVGFTAPALTTWLQHDSDDDYWRALDQTRTHPLIRVPGHHSGGWFDHISRGNIHAFNNIRTHGATEAARGGQKLIIGPWGHQNTGVTGPEHTRYGEWEFGPEADVPIMAREFQCLDCYLKDIDNGYTAQPPVRAFVMGENCWESFRAWPPSETRTQSWYLTSNGSANTRSGDGELVPVAPDRQRADEYTYDPADPVPVHGGVIYWGFEHPLGPTDQRPVLGRPDILYYRSAMLERPLWVVGEVALETWVVSDAEDTDFIAKLCVEQPDGAVVVLTNGSLRCRYRDAWDSPEPLMPGEPVLLHIGLGHTAYVFPQGSRVALMITSSEFPRILPHPNIFAPTLSTAEPRRARNAVLHGADVPSRLILPVIDM